MRKLMKYLLNHKLAVLTILILLVIQAMCDLALPGYMSDIVDVGIQQGGIESAAAEQMSAKSFEMLCMLLGEDGQYVRDAYTFKDGVYYLGEVNKETKEILSEKISDAVFQAYQIYAGEGMPLSESMKEQYAVAFVKGEYNNLGVDVASIQRKYLLVTGAKMIGVTLIMVLTAVGVGFLGARTAAKIGKELRGKLFTKVIGFSSQDIDKFSTASLITRSTNDVQQVQMTSVMMLRMVLYAPIVGIGGIIKVSNTHTGMGWIIAVAVISIMLLVSVLMSVALPKFKIMQSLVDKVNLVSREILTGIPVIRAFSREKHEEKRFDAANKELMSTQLFTNRVMAVMMPAMMLIMNGITVLIVWMGSKGIDMGNLQVGDMMAFITYTMQIVMSFLMITMLSVMLPRAGVAADRIEEVLKTESSIKDPAVNKDSELKDVKGVVEFNNVSFMYDGAKGDALTDISFKAEPGKTTAIIGSTGCGKTTVINLITRFYDATKGSVTLDGVDVRELSQEKLRSVIGLVPQKSVLFSGTIASNIKYGDESMSDEQMLEAATIAQATEFIENKEDKYDSSISQGGTNVSGGQKQRLSIARAIAYNPKVYIFDDSFSALDFKTDAALRKALSEKTKDASVIIVAQRISTIMNADQIIVLDEGKIAGMGTHKELLESCKEYIEIAKSQLSEAELNGEVR